MCEASLGFQRLPFKIWLKKAGTGNFDDDVPIEQQITDHWYV